MSTTKSDDPIETSAPIDLREGEHEYDVEGVDAEAGYEYDLELRHRSGTVPAHSSPAIRSRLISTDGTARIDVSGDLEGWEAVVRKYDVE